MHAWEAISVLSKSSTGYVCSYPPISGTVKKPGTLIQVIGLDFLHAMVNIQKQILFQFRQEHTCTRTRAHGAICVCMHTHYTHASAILTVQDWHFQHWTFHDLELPQTLGKQNTQSPQHTWTCNKNNQKCRELLA